MIEPGQNMAGEKIGLRCVGIAGQNESLDALRADRR